jgi:hypothetical protein
MLKLFATKAKEMLADFAHLNLFGTFGDSVAAMVAVNMLKRHVAAVADSTARLHCSIGRIAYQTVGTVITHRYQVGEFHKAFDIGTITLH